MLAGPRRAASSCLSTSTTPRPGPGRTMKSDRYDNDAARSCQRERAQHLGCRNAPIAASSLITSVSNLSGDSITYYAFWDAGTGNGYFGDTLPGERQSSDAGTGNGHFTLNDAIQPDGQWIVVSANNLSSVEYVGGASPGSEALFVTVYDATTGSGRTLPLSSLSRRHSRRPKSRATLSPLREWLFPGRRYCGNRCNRCGHDDRNPIHQQPSLSGSGHDDPGSGR